MDSFGIMFLLNVLVVVSAFMNKLGRPADAGRVEKDLKCCLATAVGCTRIFFFCFSDSHLFTKHV